MPFYADDDEPQSQGEVTMKSRLLALAFVVAMTSAASAKVNWQGEVMVIAVSGAACAANKIAVADHYLSAYLPQNISDNGPASYISFVTRRSAFSARFTSTAAGSPYSATRVTGRGNFATSSGQILNAFSTPATVTLTTPTLVINAQISNWEGAVGCTATIRGAYVKRVD
jgi:hypothetical protein